MLIPLILSVFVIGVLGVGGYLFWKACRRVPDYPWLDRDAMMNTSYAPYVDFIQYSDAWLKSHKAKDVWTVSDDGLKLHGLWISAENPIGTIVLIHGYHSTYLVDFGRALDFYHRQGLNILLPDHRCHGKSEGKYITFGIKESNDMLSWLHYLSDNLWDGPVILSGMSMGASTVMYMVDSSLPNNVCGLITDCGFSTPAGIIGKVFKDVTHLPSVPWIFGAELFAKVLGKFSLWEKNSLCCLQENRLPIFMVHGLEDDFVPCEMTKRAFAVCGGDKELLLVEGAGHGLSFLKDKQRYGDGVSRLLKKSLGEAYELRNN